MEQAVSAQRKYHVAPSHDLKLACCHFHHGAIPLSTLGPVLIASPHPDDETLGCGGLIARCAEIACPVSVLSMTNGEGSHPGDTAWQEKLGNIRKREQHRALKALGLKEPDIISLGLSDGGMEQLTGAMYERVVAVIQDVIQSRSIRTVFVPAIDDRHADHQQTARFVTEAVATLSVAHFFSYQIWPPEQRPTQVTANEVEYCLNISDIVGVKHRAIRKHQSQLAPIDSAHTEGFRMPQELLKEKLKAHESYALVRDMPAWCGRLNEEAILPQ
ncbi:PIG-L deacetylase family protein [Marinobacter sp. ATCH36]|uniref:PIG-L deacetylase family protein n=1 Tax=Marinobacter sp. ATCH36 TaxID=2945106 RepID=UPI002022872C|nr:PIG-L deacetylase family protein [Marinobacter sp. ATCH36]MCL7945387.1 PIG-L family deacetylase [Marinobacter sp. ATCH36]